MAPLVAGLNTYTFRSTRSSNPPSSFRMPHVFVIPPEEEQQDNPPWCCFDADEQPKNNRDLPSNPGVHSFDVPHLLQRSMHDMLTPIARGTSVNQLRPRASVPKKLEKKQHPEAIKIIENKPSQTRGGYQRDSDVIEVVKVKRGREALMDMEENTNAKRSKTLRARATKALQSIKNVGKSSHRTHVKELWTSTESMPGIFKGVQEQFGSQQNQTNHHPPISTVPAKKGSLSQSNSRSLSQIFLPMKPSPPEESFTLRVASSAAPAEATTNPTHLPHLTYSNTNPYPSLNPSTHTIDDAQNRQAPLKPSVKKTLNAKFSVRELHRLFSFSPSPPDELSSTLTATTIPFLSAPSKSTSSVSTSTLSSGCPDLPAGRDMHTDTHLLSVESANRRLASRHDRAFRIPCSNGSTLRHLSDASFEMKLDSLHFDSLSFDPDDFDVSMEGNGNTLR